MLKRNVLKLIGIVLAAVTLSSCLVTKPYKKPDINTKDLYPFHRVALDSTTLADMPWQQVFHDPQLQDLIHEALENNLNLKDAIQQIRVAEANFYQGKMGLVPTLSANANASENETSDNSVGRNTTAGEQYAISLSSSWELDIWGKLTSAKRASLAALLNTEASRRAVQTRLIADVASTYYQLLALDKKLAITQQTVTNRRMDVKTVKALKKGAIVNGASVQQSIASQYAAQVMIPELKQQIVEQEDALDLLLGRNPGPVRRTTLAQQQPINTLATGVPAQLLNNRPDVIAAEYLFRNAFELTNNARAYFYPSLTLTAEGGFKSSKTANLFDPGSLFYNLAAGLMEPILNKGQNRTRLKTSKAQQKQAYYDLKKTILQAGQEVTNTLSSFNHSKQKAAYSQKQLSALQKAVNYSRKLLQNGMVNYTQVLTAQQNYLSAQINHVNDKLDELIAGVNLYQALGGGWKQWTGKNKELPAPQEKQMKK
jgi:NodT family efflux transporter outer membrane factor (OMF) lipoprotein